LSAWGLAPDDAGGNLQRRKQVHPPVAFVGTLEAVDDLAATGVNITSGALQRLNRGLLINTEHQRVCGGLRYNPITSAALAANSASVLTHHERCRCMPSLRKARHTASSETPSALANETPSQLDIPAGSGRSNCVSNRLRSCVPYLGGLPGRGASFKPSTPLAAKRRRQRPTTLRPRPSCSAIWSLRLPLKTAKTMRARSAMRTSPPRLRAKRSSSDLASGVHDSATATRDMHSSHTYAVTSDGQAYCWGANGSRLGNRPHYQQ